MGWWKLFAQGDKGQEAEERDNDTRHWGWPVPFTPATLSLPPVHHLRAFSLHGWGRGQAPVPRGPGLSLWPAGSQGHLWALQCSQAHWALSRPEFLEIWNLSSVSQTLEAVSCKINLVNHSQYFFF